jgi:hypothetical protein
MLRYSIPASQCVLSRIARVSSRLPHVRNSSADIRASASSLYMVNLSSSWLFRADLSNANLTAAKLSKATLYEADLTKAEFYGADLCNARFTGAILDQTRFLDADLQGAFFFRARLSNTEMSAHQLGGSIGEERAKKYVHAAEAYSRLKSNFESIGRYGDAGWAYCKERRMRKRWAAEKAVDSWNRGGRRQAIRERVHWATDWIVELLCDYGESAWRVVAWMAILFFIVGPLSILWFGGLQLSYAEQVAYSSMTTIWEKESYLYSQYLLHMVDTLTTADYSSSTPANDAVRLVSGLMSMAFIFLIGLLGFVTGNRIRNS